MFQKNHQTNSLHFDFSDDTLTKKRQFFAKVCRFQEVLIDFRGTLTKNRAFLCQGQPTERQLCELLNNLANLSNLLVKEFL